MIRTLGGSHCRPHLALLALSVGLSLLGCDAAEPAADSGSTGNLGSVGLNLQSGGVTLTRVNFTIIGNGFSKSGVIDVANSTQIVALIGGIPAGNGYSVTLNAEDAGSTGVSCSGSASFNVTAGATSSTQIHLQCRAPANTGSVLLNGSINVCPVIEALSVAPTEARVGGAMSLNAVASDSDLKPNALGYIWSSTGGVLSGATTESATLTCTAVGPLTVTLVVSDGDCSDTLTQTVNCSPATSGAGGAGGASAGGASAGGASAGGASAGGASAGGASAGGASAGGASAGGASAGGAGGTSGGASAGASGSGGFAGGSASFGSIKINEIESNGGVPDDWVELYNTGAQAIDISGYVFKDNDDAHSFAIPAATVVLPGAYYVMDTGAAGFNFGLGAADSARLFLPGAAVLVDAFSWTAHAATTYGRCPNGVGAFGTTVSSTKGSANDCGAGTGSGGAGGGTAGMGGSSGTAGSGGTGGNAGNAGGAGAAAFSVWPGGNDVVTVDVENTFPSNLSGLFYEPPAASSPEVLWGAQNAPSKLYRLLWNGVVWTQDVGSGWAAGKTLHYASGLGSPDTEGVTKAGFGSTNLYVSTERDNENNGVSRLCVLMFDGTGVDPTISALRDWNLTADLPVVGANLGLEAIAWVPDAYLVSKGFLDESKNLPYDPASYPDHAEGVFFVGLEANGVIYGYVLDHVSGGFTRVATIQSGNAAIMDLSFDRDVGYLWAACDDTCQGRTNVLDIDVRAGSQTRGKFIIRRGFERPSSMLNTNNEGFTVTPESTCVGGFKPVFYADDNDANLHAIRRDSIPCGPFL